MKLEFVKQEVEGKKRQYLRSYTSDTYVYIDESGNQYTKEEADTQGYYWLDDVSIEYLEECYPWLNFHEIEEVDETEDEKGPLMLYPEDASPCALMIAGAKVVVDGMYVKFYNKITNKKLAEVFVNFDNIRVNTYGKGEG